MSRLTIIFMILLGCLNASAQTLVVDKTNKLRNDKLIICGLDNKFDTEAVNDLLRQDLRIVSVSYTAQGWTIAMAKGTGFKKQDYQVSSEYPKDWISERLQQGMRISSLSYGNGNYCVVLSSGLPFGEQNILGLKDWNNVETVLKEKNEENIFITSCTYCNNKWLFVLTPDSYYSKQIYIKIKNGSGSEADLEKIRQYRNKGYIISSLASGNGETICVMSELNNNAKNQTEDIYLIPPTNFRNELRDFWDQGYHIVGIFNGVLPK